MIRYLILLVVLTVCIYTFLYVLSKKERKEGKKLAFKWFVSAVISALIMSAVYLINNLQGV